MSRNSSNLLRLQEASTLRRTKKNTARGDVLLEKERRKRHKKELIHQGNLKEKRKDFINNG